MTDLEHEIIDAATGELVPWQPQHASLFRTDDPAEIVQNATQTAALLAEIVRRQNLSVNIRGREHVRVEGWTLLGSLLGVFPVCTWTRQVEAPAGSVVGWEARVEARTRDGAVVGAAEAECLRMESSWQSRDDYALRSMAQTRATSKALRLPLGFVMALAGFDPTPADEMPAVEVETPDEGKPKSQKSTISEAQRGLLKGRWRATGLPDQELLDHLQETYEIEHTADIPKAKFQELLKWVAEKDEAPI